MGMKITVSTGSDGFSRQTTARRGWEQSEGVESRSPQCIDIGGSRMSALQDRLEIVIPMNSGTKKKKDEVKDFSLYLNYAVSNLREITGIRGDDDVKIKEQLEKLPDERMQRLADFLWTFRFNEPQRDFSARGAEERQFDHDYKRLAPLVANKIFELRNYFAHIDRNGNEPLVCDRDLYVLLEGILRPKAESECMGPGCQTSKLYEMHLANLRGPRKPLQPMESRTYDLTRRGIMFLVCMALYKDDAEEFLSCFADMRVPNRRRDSLDGLTEEQIGKLGRNKPTKRAFLKAFTFFSYRRGRVSLDGENPDFLDFTNIIGYLNKVPPASFDYLALEDEKNLLRDLESCSTESVENKFFKYDLSKQIRAKNRFVSLAAAWCERFDVLPCMRFKRLDITPSLGRHRYLFGKEKDNTVHLDRHYIIEDGAIRFEWLPTEHCGNNIKVGSLRSCIGEAEFRRLLFCALRKPTETNAMLSSYFTAYHKILELMLNAEVMERCSVFSNDELAVAVQTVSGLTKDEIADDPERLQQFFPKNLWRFFIGWEGVPDEDDLKVEVETKIAGKIGWCDDFLVRVENFRKWHADNFWKPRDQRGPQGVCPKTELVNPPRDYKVSDASCVARVIAYLDFHLAPEHKFRQLSLGEQHCHPDRKDTHNYEYQMVQSAIGKYALDQTSAVGEWKEYNDKKDATWLKNKLVRVRTVERFDKTTKQKKQEAVHEYLSVGSVESLRPELHDVLAKLRDKVEEIRGAHIADMTQQLKTAERRRCLHGFACLDAKDALKSAKRSRKLIDLAEAAIRLFQEELSERLKKLPSGGNDLKVLCRKFGVRTGLPFDRDALVKTILGIDIDKWVHAFDYEHGHPYIDRKLTDGEHVAAQIPLPNGMAERVIRSQPRVFGDVMGTSGLNWAKAFASLDDKNISLLGFYDVSPLVGYIKAHANHAEELPDSSAAGINTWMDADPRAIKPDFSRGGINNAIRAIKTAHNQDRLLLKMALQYWEEFKKTKAYDERKTTYEKALTVRDYFNGMFIYALKGGIGIRLSRNDVFSHTFAHICENGGELVKLLGRECPGVKEFSFYDVAQLFARKQRESRRLRMEMLPALEKFATKCSIPQEEYARAELENDTQQEKTLARRAMEFSYYSKAMPTLTEAEYNLVADVRNAIMHSTLLVTDDDDYRKAKAVLDRLNCSC